MSGLEKILSHINEEAEAAAKAVRAEAEAKAKAVKAEIEEKKEDECDRIRKKTEAEVKNILERGASSAELKKKQILLGSRQELIKETIDRAAASLLAMPEDDYFALVWKLFEKHLPQKDAELCFGETDLKRLPEDLLLKMQAAAKDKGCALTVSKEAAPVKSGFVLKFGGVEENCSFEALLDDNMEYLQDQINRVLFA